MTEHEYVEKPHVTVPARAVDKGADVTPALLREHVWFTPAWLRRGYDEDEVDALLDVVADRVESLLVENNQLRLRLEQMTGDEPKPPSS